MSILFVDNDAKKRRQVSATCPSVDVIAVSDALAQRTVALPPTLTRKRGQTVRVRYRAGINPRTFAQIRQWLKETPPPHTILFDWGRTITQLQGVRVAPQTRRSALAALCGGTRRLASLRRGFRHLKAAGARLGLLTNNRSCTVPAFRALAADILGTPNPLIVCSTDHKGEALRKHGLCDVRS